MLLVVKSQEFLGKFPLEKYNIFHFSICVCDRQIEDLFPCQKIVRKDQS